ncbi:flocculation protein FLO11-like [Cucumis melo var. makuwa]|uniref:Flocculation protein FLO11-like n=1 Tax=Cucumis melo var. makuwa TaxID=1194695 RepID=A0A5A7T741_CUCMM|nr:flocculation protein FLO11-like [Cucumis melo var. makuwa]TYJ99735.1 flocculation protein FLO11-like [Cucumis melo var. makuwa]
MVTTRFKSYQSSASTSTYYTSTTSVFNSMASSPPKAATTTKGKRYKGIPTRHPFKKIHRLVVATDVDQHSLYAGRFSNPMSPVTVKREVPSRVSVETVVLDSDSSDGTNNIILSKLFHRKTGHRTDPSSTPSHPTQVLHSPSQSASPPKDVSSRPMDHGKSSTASSFLAYPQTSLPTDDDGASDDTNEIMFLFAHYFVEYHLFQGSHIPDVAVEFDNAPGQIKSAAATHSTVGQSLVLFILLANLLLQALMVESRSLTRHISELFDRRTMLDAILCDLRRVAFGPSPSPSKHQD